MASYGITNPYQPPPQEPYQPYDPMAGGYYGQLGSNWQIQPGDYLSQFTDAYNDLISKMQAPTGYNVGNAGLGNYLAGGMYDIGTAGQGQWQPGQAGIGQWQMPDYLANLNIGKTGLGQWEMPDYLANLNIGQTGMGGYSSDLLSKLASTYQQMITNPNESIAMGLARDRITGAGTAAQQSLADVIGGMGIRGSGPAAYQQQALNTALAQQEANAYRDIGLQSQQQALTGSQQLEQLRGSLYEQEKSRELQNMAQQLQLQVQKGTLSQQAYENAMQRELQNMDQQLRLQVSKGQLSQQAYQDAMQRELANAGLSQTGYESAMQRQLTGAGMQGGFYEQAQNRAQTAFEDWQKRQLQNAQLGLQAYNTGQGNLSNYYGMFPSMLGQLGNMLQWAGGQNVGAQQQSFQNLQGLSADEQARLRQQYDVNKQYYGDIYNWMNQMQNWTRDPTKQYTSPWTKPVTQPSWTG